MNSTIIRKKKKCATCNSLTYIFSHGNCKECSTIKSTQKRVEKHEEQEESESIQNLISDLDFVFSQYIRCKYADVNGIVECFTSGKKMKWQEAQCGHFISRGHYGLRFLEDNCRPQSEYDNCNLSGNLSVFAANLEKERSGTVEWLQRLSKEVYKPTREELKQLLAEYRYKLNDIKKKFKK